MSIGKSIINTSIAKQINFAITAIIGIIIARVYGPEGKGFIVAILIVPQLISTFGNISFGEGLIYFLSKSKISKSQYFNTVNKFICITTFCLIIVFLMYNYFFSKVDSIFSVLVQALLIISLVYQDIFRSTLRGLLMFRFYNKILIIEGLINIITLTILIILGISFEIVVIIYVISTTITNVLMAIKTSRNMIGKQLITVSEIIKYSYKVHIFKIINTTEAKFDLLFLTWIASYSNVGIYSVAISLSLIYQGLIQSPLSTVLFPSLSSIPDEKKKESLSLFYFRISLFLGIITAIIMISIGKPLIYIMFGKEYLSAYTPFIILIIGTVLKNPAAIFNSYFKSIGEPEKLFKTSIITVIVNISLCLLLIPKFNIKGAAIASSISYALFGLIMLIKFMAKSNYPISILFLKRSDISYTKTKVINLIRKFRLINS